MKILDVGHEYLLDRLDGVGAERLVFVKREGDKFPFNHGTHPGTNVQEVLRALIDRTEYLNKQIPCAETEAALGNLKSALLLFELRVARCHDRQLELHSLSLLSSLPTCKICKHIGCKGHEQ